MASYLVSDSENSAPGSILAPAKKKIANIRQNGLICTGWPLAARGIICLLQSVLC